MKKILKSILPGLLLITCATPSLAENRQGAFSVSPFVGGYLLDDDQQMENRPAFGLRGGYNFTENLGVEVMGSHSLTQTKQEFGSRETDVYRYGVDALFHFMPNSKLVPFIAAGIGCTKFKTPDTLFIKNHTAYLFNYGVGLKYFVAPDVALRADVRHVILPDGVSNGDYSGNNNLEYSVGVTFQFGGERKAVEVETAAAAVVVAVKDTTPPAVTCISPSNGAIEVPVYQKVNVAFNEEMDPATLSTSTFKLIGPDLTPVKGKVESDGKTANAAIFTPTNKLAPGTRYTAMVTPGAKDRAGNALPNNYEWRFTTPVPIAAPAKMAADTPPPVVLFVAPVNNATAAPVDEKVNVAFNEIMDPATLTTETFIVKQGATPVAGTVTTTPSTATFTPSSDFEKGKPYSATVTTGTRDTAGNAMVSDYVWNFKALATPKVVPVCLVTLQDNHFIFNSSEIAENGKTILHANALILRDDPKMNLRIAGYTSASGTPEYNQKLSEQRADAVRNFLIKEGKIDKSRLISIGYGETNPAEYEAVPSDIYSEAAKANQRVLFEVIVK